MFFYKWYLQILKSTGCEVKCEGENGDGAMSLQLSAGNQQDLGRGIAMVQDMMDGM